MNTNYSEAMKVLNNVGRFDLAVMNTMNGDTAAAEKLGTALYKLAEAFAEHAQNDNTARAMLNEFAERDGISKLNDLLNVLNATLQV